MQRTRSLLLININLLILAFLLLSLLPSYASAHANSVGTMDIEEKTENVRIDLNLDYTELARAVELPVNLDSSPSSAELEQALSERKDVLIDYLSSGMKLYRDELICEPQLINTKVSTIDNSPLANFQLLYSCEGEFTRISYDLFVDDLNHSHINFATVTGDKGGQEFTFSITEREMVIGERNWLNQGLNFIILGIEHIVTGYDHILFVLCLLLPAAVSIGRVVEVVTAFTLGHSITLGLATLGIVTLPGILVESAIALSIIYVAVENLLKKETKHRWVVTLLFGLIHGFGFAGILQELELSHSTIASSLLFFNIGVEIGQIAIIALVFPMLVILRRYKPFPVFVSISSLSIITMGLFWFVQRAAGL